MQILTEFTTTETGEEFLTFDSWQNNDRILIFSNRRNLRSLALSGRWYVNGTFKTVPALFSRLCTIHEIDSTTLLCLLRFPIKTN